MKTLAALMSPGGDETCLFNIGLRRPSSGKYFFFNSQFILFKLSDSVIRRKVESVMTMVIFYEGVTMETAAILDLL